MLQLNLMCQEHFCQRIRTDSCRKNFQGTLKILGTIRVYQDLTLVFQQELFLSITGQFPIRQMFTSTTFNYILIAFELPVIKTSVSLVVSVNICRPLIDEVCLPRPRSKEPMQCGLKKAFKSYRGGQ